MNEEKGKKNILEQYRQEVEESVKLHAVGGKNTIHASHFVRTEMLRDRRSKTFWDPETPLLQHCGLLLL
jgi:hypothetical protein